MDEMTRKLAMYARSAIPVISNMSPFMAPAESGDSKPDKKDEGSIDWDAINNIINSTPATSAAEAFRSQLYGHDMPGDDVPRDIYIPGHGSTSNDAEDDNLTNNDKANINNGVVGQYTYKDIQGVLFTREWKISNDMFLNAKDMTENSIKTLLSAKNNVLCEKGYDRLIYTLANQFNHASISNKGKVFGTANFERMLKLANGHHGINPKIILATLKHEHSYGKDNQYNDLFGAGASGADPEYQVTNCIMIYIRGYYWGLIQEHEEKLEGLIYNLDHSGQDGPYSTSENTYVQQGQKINVANAAMYARLSYNSWLFFPRGSSAESDTAYRHFTHNWHETVINDY